MMRHQPPAAMYLPLANLRQGMGGQDGAERGFEAALEAYLGVRACFTASSARTGLYLLLEMLAKSRPGRSRVLLPGYTCPALVKVILDVGLRPFAVDISPTTFAFDEQQFREALDEQVLAVIHVHPFGIPLAVEGVIGPAHGVGAVVIEDAAQAMGAKWQGKQVGTLGDFGLFSLGPGKPMSLAGGGVVCTNDEGQAQLLRRLWEKLPAADARDSGLALIRSLMIRLVTHPRGWWLAARAGSQRLGERPESWGYRVGRLSPLQSRIGPAQLAELDGLNRLRLENGRQLATRLGGLSFVQVPELTGEAEPVYLRLPLLAETAECRERLYKRLWSANMGVGRLYRQPLPALFPQMEGGACPGAARVAECLLTLPTHHYLRQDDIDLMVAVIGG